MFHIDAVAEVVKGYRVLGDHPPAVASEEADQGGLGPI